MQSATYSDVKEKFEQDGFVVLEDVFSNSEISAISDEVDDVINGNVSYLPASEIVYEPDFSPKRVRNAFRLHLYNQKFLDAAKHPNLIDPLTAILGDHLRLYVARYSLSPLV